MLKSRHMEHHRTEILTYGAPIMQNQTKVATYHAKTDIWSNLPLKIRQRLQPATKNRHMEQPATKNRHMEQPTTKNRHNMKGD
jgi:hypothetical protein